MYADHDVRAPTLKKLFDKPDAAFLKELASFRAKAVDAPVEILHPVLPVTQQPVVKVNQLSCYRVGFFDRFYNSHCVRLTIEELLHAGNNRRRSGTMSATGVGRDD